MPAGKVGYMTGQTDRRLCSFNAYKQNVAGQKTSVYNSNCRECGGRLRACIRFDREGNSVYEHCYTKDREGTA